MRMCTITRRGIQTRSDANLGATSRDQSLPALVRRYLTEVGITGGMVSGLDHGPANVLAACLGDAPAMVGAPRVVHAGAQPGIANQVLGVREARDIADGRQQRGRADQPVARATAPAASGADAASSAPCVFTFSISLAGGHIRRYNSCALAVHSAFREADSARLYAPRSGLVLLKRCFCRAKGARSCLTRRSRVVSSLSCCARSF